MIKTLSFILLLVVPVSAASQESSGNRTFNLKNADPVLFSHDYHIKTRGVKCSACHFKTFAASGNSFQMKHEKMTKRDFCEHCHNGLKGFDAQSEKNCGRCHKR
jgi:c(7)-type cytochrome triheme protein